MLANLVKLPLYISRTCWQEAMVHEARIDLTTECEDEDEPLPLAWNESSDLYGICFDKAKGKVYYPEIDTVEVDRGDVKYFKSPITHFIFIKRAVANGGYDVPQAMEPYILGDAQAWKHGASEKLTVIHGPPGCGKTHTICSMI